MPDKDLVKDLGLEPAPAEDVVGNLGLETIVGAMSDPEGFNRAVAPTVQAGANEPRSGEAAVRSAGHMASLGADDRVYGALAGIGHALAGGDYNEGYNHYTNEAREGREKMANDAPISATFGGGVGAVAGSKGMGALATAAKSVPVVGRVLSYLGGTAEAAKDAGVVTRAATAVGNNAIPGAVQGAMESRDLGNFDETAPAALGSATAQTLIGAPFQLAGTANRYLAKPSVGEAALASEAKNGFMATGMRQPELAKMELLPGGQVETWQRAKEMGVGEGWYPRPATAAKQSAKAAEALDIQRQALADQAAHVQIPTDEVAASFRKYAADLPPVSREADVNWYNQQAIKHEGQGVPEYGPPQSKAVTGELEPAQAPEMVVEPPQAPVAGQLPPPGPGDALQRFSAPEPPTPAPAAQRPADELFEPTGRRMQTFPELNQEVRGYNSQAKNFMNDPAAGSSVERMQNSGRFLNDVLETNANKLPEDVGTQWRNAKRDEALALDINTAATRTEVSGGTGAPGQLQAGGRMMAGALGAANPGLVLPLAAGKMASVPGFRQKAAEGVFKLHQAAAKVENSALARILRKAPPGTGSALARTAAEGARISMRAQEGIDAVQQAALSGDTDAVATEHFRQNMTNPDYQALANVQEAQE